MRRVSIALKAAPEPSLGVRVKLIMQQASSLAQDCWRWELALARHSVLTSRPQQKTDLIGRFNKPQGFQELIGIGLIDP